MEMLNIFRYKVFKKKNLFWYTLVGLTRLWPFDNRHKQSIGTTKEKKESFKDRHVHAIEINNV